MSNFSTLALGGGMAAALAVISWLGDHRRMRRRNLDRVGVMPWTALFFLALFAACILLGLAAREALAG